MSLMYQKSNLSRHTGYTFFETPFLYFTVRFFTLLNVWHQTRNDERTFIEYQRSERSTGNV